MKELIVGSTRHGKDTLAEQLNISYRSSSMFCAERFIYATMVNNGYGYNSVEECFNDRHNHRELWHWLIKEYNTPDAARAAKEILAESDGYVGMRSKREVRECFFQKLFGRVYWVDASKRLPPKGRSQWTLTWIG